MKQKSFAEFLLKKKLLTEEQIRDIWAEVHLKKKEFHAILYEKQLLPEKTVAENYAEFLKLDFIDLNDYLIDPVTAKLIPEHIAKKHLVVAINKIGPTLIVAMADPLNIIAIDDIHQITGLTLRLNIAAPGAITKGIQASYG